MGQIPKIEDWGRREITVRQSGVSISCYKRAIRIVQVLGTNYARIILRDGLQSELFDLTNDSDFDIVWTALLKIAKETTTK